MFCVVIFFKKEKGHFIDWLLFTLPSLCPWENGRFRIGAVRVMVKVR